MTGKDEKMLEEKEIKLQLHSSFTCRELEQKLERIGFRKKSQNLQTDIYWDTPKLKLHEINHVLRTRSENNQVQDFVFKTLYYLPKRKSHWFVEEICFKFPISQTKKLNALFERLEFAEKPNGARIGFEALALLLKQNGVQKIFEIEKNRSSFRKGSVKIEVDEVKDLGLFLEIESQEDPQLLVDLLNLRTISEEVRFGYTTLFLQKYFGKDYSNIKEKYLKEPEWNVLPTEKKTYERINQAKS